MKSIISIIKLNGIINDELVEANDVWLLLDTSILQLSLWQQNFVDPVKSIPDWHESMHEYVWKVVLVLPTRKEPL